MALDLEEVGSLDEAERPHKEGCVRHGAVIAPGFAFLSLIRPSELPSCGLNFRRVGK